MGAPRPAGEQQVHRRWPLRRLRLLAEEKLRWEWKTTRILASSRPAIASFIFGEQHRSAATHLQQTADWTCCWIVLRRPMKSSRIKVTPSVTNHSLTLAQVPLHRCLPRSWSSGALNTKSFKPSCCPSLETASDSSLRIAGISSPYTGLTWLSMRSVKSCSQSAPTLSSNTRRTFGNATSETEPLLAAANFLG